MEKVDLKDPELKKKIDEILNREVDPLYNELANRIEPRIKEHKYLPLLLAYKINTDVVKMLLALPDPEWTPEMGKFTCSDAFVERTGFSREFIETELKNSFYRGDLTWFDRAEVTCGITLWHDLQNSRHYYEKNGHAYYKVLSYFYDNEMTSYIWERDVEERNRENKRGVARVIPRYDSVKDHPELLPAENYREILKSRDLVVQNQCICRVRHPEMGLDPMVCLNSNATGKLAVELGIGREIPWEEAFDYVQKQGKKEPHVHINRHAETLEGIGDTLCNCHPDVCIVMRKATVLGSKYKLEEYYGKSRFRAVIDPHKCVNCGLCARKRCTFDAIHLRHNFETKDERHFVIEPRCMGCGCCVETCPKQAIAMECVEPPEVLKGYKIKPETADKAYEKPKSVLDLGAENVST